MRARGVVWLAGSLAAVLLGIAAIVLLRGTAPERPQIAAAPPATAPKSAPAAAAAPPPSFDVVSVDRHGQAVIAGRAEPGDRVRILDGDKALGEVTADARGDFVLVPLAPIAPGNHQLTLEAEGRGGGAARRSADAVALTVAPPAAKPGSETVAVLLPGDADRPARILQRPEPGVARTLGLDSVEYGADGQLTLSGHALPGARVAVNAGGQPLGTATADSAGRWTLSAHWQPPTGGAELHLAELDAGSAVAQSIATKLAPAAPGGTYVVARGNSLWHIAREAYGNGLRYTAIYRANHAQIHDPGLIYPGQRFTLPRP